MNFQCTHAGVVSQAECPYCFERLEHENAELREKIEGCPWCSAGEKPALSKYRQLRQERDSAVKDNAELLRATDDLREVVKRRLADIAGLLKEREAIMQERDAALADKERLDWLDSQPTFIWSGSVREAIDAARSKGLEKK